MIAFRLQPALNSTRRTARRVPRVTPENRLVKSTSSPGESALEAPARDPDDRDAGGAPAAATSSTAEQSGPVGLQKAELEALIAREYAGLRLLISRRAGDPQVGADLLNDALCITWEKWQSHQLDRPDCIAGYIFRVAMNLLRNHRRSAVERTDRRIAPAVLDTLEQETTEKLEDKLASRVKAALRDMGGARDREVLMRFYLRDEDGESICRDLSLTPTQLARILHRARGRLRKLLESGGMKKSDLFSILLVM